MTAQELIIQILYTGKGHAARDFMQEMIDSGTVEKIRNQSGNLAYDYYLPVEDENSLLLIDRWESQTALDQHHKSEMMAAIAELRDKYKLKMTVTRYQTERK